MAIGTIRPQRADKLAIWEEESGLFSFLASVNTEVKRFDDAFDFGVGMLPGQPESVDDSTVHLKHLGFVVVRRNSALIGRDYCLYSVLQGKTLYGYIGVYSEGSIMTVRELSHMTDFKKAQAHLLGWLRDLVKASCEKI